MFAHKEQIVEVQFSPTNPTIGLSVSYFPAGAEASHPSRDNSVRVWNLSTGGELLHLEGCIHGEFSPDGKSVLVVKQHFAKGDEPYVAEIWRIKDRALVASSPLAGYSPRFSRVHFFLNGTNVAAYDYRRAVVYRTHPFAPINEITFDRFTPQIRSFAFDSLTGELITKSPDSVAVWDLKSGQQLAELPEKAAEGPATDPGDRGRMAVFLENGQGLITSDKDIVTGWAPRFARKLFTLECPGPIVQMLVSPTNTTCVTAWSDDSQFPNISAYILWNLRTSKRNHEFSLAPWQGLIAYDHSGRTFLVGGDPFLVIDAANGRILRTLHLVPSASADNWSTQTP